jgi:hypothetical protein
MAYNISSASRFVYCVIISTRTNHASLVLLFFLFSLFCMKTLKYLGKQNEGYVVSRVTLIPSCMFVLAVAVDGLRNMIESKVIHDVIFI